jgi:predicted phage baseplate assembly protein
LGNGDSRQKFQTFKLPKSPLTYHNLPGETPPEVPELQIYVNDRLWKRVPTLFNHKPDEEIYIVREDSNGDSWVQFGDGKTGKQLPSGLKNVIAKYRTGIGAYGPLKPDTKVQASGRLDKLDKIHLPGIVTGGAKPESGENAREAAPGKIQSLDRLVSLQDFESETLAIPGVSKALAAWELVDNLPNVVITVLMETGRDLEFSEVAKILSHYNRCRGSQRFPIDVRKGDRNYVYIAANVAFNPTFRQELVSKAIHSALGITGENDGLFSLKNRRFGQKEYANRIAGTIQNVEGVLWVEVTGLISLGTADEPDKINLSKPIKPNPNISCTTQQILSLYPSHLKLNPVSTPSSNPC